MLGWTLKKILGTKHEREVKKLRPLVDEINRLEDRVAKLSDQELRARTASFKEKIDNGASVDDLLAPAFATVREAGKRVLGMRHYDVQMVGGVVLHQGKVAEMRTGEGKTLVATLPCYLNALEGRGVHVVTVNDYLAKRDAEWMGKLHAFLGLTTGVIVPQMPNAAKKRAYACDITYGQNNEFGFDYMRDNMKFSIYDYVQRELHYAIVDEVDSILIDEARTPLIISGPGETASDKYVKINALIPKLRKDEHYEVDEKGHSAALTEEGMEYAQGLLRKENLLVGSGNLYDPVNLESLHILQKCITAHALYHRDRNYLVSPDGKVMIIDEHTNRVLAGRRWSDGLHQAVEAKEQVPIQEENITLATISFQNLFRLYNKLSGMTGTADTEAAEFHKIYELDCVVIPTNKPIQRVDHNDLIYKTEKEKFKAIVSEIRDANTRKQPVLVGTTSVEKSEALHRLLDREKIDHNVLNAKQHESEAYVVAQAGMPGAVTVATNMAGRGTDIILGGNPEMLARMEVLQSEDEAALSSQAATDAAVEKLTPKYEAQCKTDQKRVLDAGGLYILGTERHESRRIDNQLRGRAGRQGDPGTSRFFLSLEDDLMRIFAGDRVQAMMDRLGMEEDIPIEHSWVTKAVENSQKKVEERNFDIRKHLLEYDDVMNQQRKSIYTLRKQVIQGQYRSVLTEEEQKRGDATKSLAKEIYPDLAEIAEPIVTQMTRLHAAPLPETEKLTEEGAVKFQATAIKREIEKGDTLRYEQLERDIYVYFGTKTDLRQYKNDPKTALERVKTAVAESLSEQRERLLDTVDELIGQMVAEYCPSGKHFEDWDYPGLAQAYQKQFGIPATGLEKETDAQEITFKLFEDAEGILKKKEKIFGADAFLRLFRNFFLEEIDKQWIDHLQMMQQLRDGIGLRGYGQRDPKKEYKREGYILFEQMQQGIRTAVISNIFRVERVEEEDLERMEAERRAAAEARQKQIDGLNRGKGRGARSGGGRAGRGRPAGGQVVATDTMRREQPKIGRNDPCHCGSGKKYKSCHYRKDQQAAAQAPQ